MTDLHLEIKQLIIDSLEFDDITVDDIKTEAPLFEPEGLGLDSIDALELGLAIHKKYAIEIDAEDESTREHFYSVKNLEKYISAELQNIS